MVIVAICSLGIAALTAAFAHIRDRYQARAHERDRQAWTVERDRLVNQVCHLTNKPWLAPPREALHEAPPLSADEQVLARTARRF